MSTSTGQGDFLFFIVFNLEENLYKPKNSNSLLISFFIDININAILFTLTYVLSFPFLRCLGLKPSKEG